MRYKFILIFISFYFISINLSTNQAGAFFDSFQNDGPLPFFKAFDALKKSMEQFKNVFENRFKTYFKLNTTSLSRKNSFPTKKFENKFVENGCKCLNLTCSCCAHIEIKKYNLSNTGIHIIKRLLLFICFKFFNFKGCVNLTYLRNDFGIELTFDLDGRVLYNNTVSGKCLLIISFLFQSK